MEHVRRAMLLAAYKHAKRTAKGAQRFDAALFFLECVYRDLRKKGHYVVAREAYSVLTEIKADKKIMPAMERLGVDFTVLNESQTQAEPPPSKTGVTPSQLSMLEEYLNG